MGRLCVFQVICGVVLATLTTTRGQSEVNSPAQPSSCPVVTNGCSIPGDLPFFFKDLFTPVCNKHDICYFCGQVRGWSRSACDLAFKEDMYSRCKIYAAGRKRGFGAWLKSLFQGKLGRCKAVADVYYVSVDKFGASNYEQKSSPWCSNACVIPLGKP